MGSSQPFFSVVIPLYNKAPYIERAIASVLAQSEQDFEIVVVNDASTDYGADKAAACADSRIQIVNRSLPGAGGYAARNLGIKRSSGRWIAFLDADDEWYPEHLARIRRTIRNFPQVEVFGSGWEYHNNRCTYENAYYTANSHDHVISIRLYLYHCLHERRPLHTICVTVSRDSPLISDLFPANRRATRGGDLHAWLKLVCTHKTIGWSNHIGARYYSNIHNQVIKTNATSPDLFRKSLFRQLTCDLAPRERYLAACYMNRRLLDGWLGNEKRGFPNYVLLWRLYWYEPLFAAFAAAITIFPGIRSLWRRRIVKKIVPQLTKVALICIKK